MTLLPFQQEAVDKLTRLPSRLIGDEMGLGKTYQALALDLEDRQLAKATGEVRVGKDRYVSVPRPMMTLIVAPLSVLEMWRDKVFELTGARAIVIDPKNRQKFVQAVRQGQAEYFICHWEALRLMPELQVGQKGPTWFHIIADECHKIKNRKAQMTHALKRIRTIYKTAMSGTPADNKPQDLWSILNWLWPKYYTSFWRFTDAYVLYDSPQAGAYRRVIGVKSENIPALHKEMAPWFVRRLKQEVLKDLPDKYYTKLPVDLSPKQKRAYHQMKHDMIAWLEKPEVSEAIERQDPMIASVVVAQLQRLQQLAVGYMEFVGTRKVKNARTGELEDKDVYRMVDPSSKLDLVMELLDDTDQQVVIFSQFKSAINLLTTRLEAAGVSYGLITGDVPGPARAAAVKKFQTGQLKVMASTIAAGGVGITLTASSTVIFIDRAWSPAMNAQAEDRLHRIGQQNSVQVIDIMARGTVDLGKAQQLDMKMKWLRQILGD